MGKRKKQVRVFIDPKVGEHLVAMISPPALMGKRKKQVRVFIDPKVGEHLVAMISPPDVCATCANLPYASGLHAPFCPLAKQSEPVQ